MGLPTWPWRCGLIARPVSGVEWSGASALSGLVAEMIQVTADIRTQWKLDSCNGILKEGCIPVWYYQFTKVKGIQWCGS